ncbi:MAG TPA: anthranilate synthase component I family protein [Flavisolibacter sp.]|jgi:para-aminobenzoate synthetase component 1|nr:anthranilate synthase component I family protein [Flavisolibacter sp.]
MLNWADRFNIFCLLDNQDYSIHPHRYECLLAAGSLQTISSDNLKDIDRFLSNNKQWTFGHLSYGLKNAIHKLSSEKQDKIGFPSFFFFVPEFLLQINGDQLLIEGENCEKIYNEIVQQDNKLPLLSTLTLQQKLSKELYIEKIKRLQQHIVKGDCYEINFCQEFFAEDASIDAVDIFQKLIGVSPNPFSALYKLNDRYLICASPERFIAKKGSKIFSQPMKGTSKRNLQNKEEDDRLKKELQQSAKERSENVMVVDMVRNDLSKICTESSVKVDELFGVYTYPQVHQMISTISGEIKPEIKFSEIIGATFPMGSMTGAPKYRVMELIDEYELSARGIFSGSVGYISPGGDFDFNVVIRSIMYNASKKYLSYQLGSGITFYSDPEKEWEECLLKGEAIKKVLTS